MENQRAALDLNAATGRLLGIAGYDHGRYVISAFVADHLRLTHTTT